MTVLSFDQSEARIWFILNLIGLQWAMVSATILSYEISAHFSGQRYPWLMAVKLSFELHNHVEISSISPFLSTGNFL